MLFWIGFHLFVVAMVFLDLKVFHRKTREITLRSTLLCSFFWVALALIFNVGIGVYLGLHPALTFFAAYLLETSLSIDNLFVFLSIFSFFHIETRYQYKVLFLGVLGALVCRIIFILFGIALLSSFHWMYFVFGGILCFTAFYLYKHKEEGDLKDSFLVNLATKILRVDNQPHEGSFFVVRQGKLYATTLFLALFLVEISDILFAIDSIPAVLGITSDPFLAYTSNVFAVLGLRSFYFLLKHLHHKFEYLKLGIVIVLFFIGIKMLLIPFWSFPNLISLFVVVLVLGSSILWSCLSNKK